MGHKQSYVKVNAKITLHGINSKVDGLKLSYKSNSCCGGRRVVATFTFPKGGWQQVSEGILQNSSSKGANVPVKKLQKKDGDTSVRITCLAGGVPVYRTQLALADLLGRLRCTVRGNEGLLLFSLAGRKGNDDKGDGHAFTTLFCNGRRCGEAPRVEAPHRPPADGGEEVEDGEGVADSPGLRGDGQELKDSPVVGEESEGVEDSPGLGGDGQGLEDIPGVGKESEGVEDTPGVGLDGEGQDVAPGQEELYDEVPAPPFHFVVIPTPYGFGGRGRGGLLKAFEIFALVVVFILLFYDEWLECSNL